MRWIHSIDDKQWYEYDGVTKLSNELNTLYRAADGYKIDETGDLFHVIITTNETKNLKLYFTSEVRKNNIAEIFNNRAHPITQSPLEKWNTTRPVDKAYVLNYDPDLEIKPPYVPEDTHTGQTDLEPIGPDYLSTPFKSAVDILRKAEHPRLLSLLIGKYHTKDHQNNRVTNEDGHPFGLFGEVGRNTKHSYKYGRCHESCLDKPRYVFRPIELCVNKRPISNSSRAISPYQSLAPIAGDVNIREYDLKKAISDIVYQKIPPEKVYRVSSNPISKLNGKSTIVLVDQNVNAVLGA